MKLDALLRVAQILRSQPAYTMPLARLHRCLAEELGTDAGTYAQMYQELKKRPHSFMVLDSPRLLDHEAYGALLEEAGLGACTRIALADLGAGEDLTSAISIAGATLSELWLRAETDPVLREYLVQAATEMERICQAMS
jgi:hypothetical protein